MPFGASWDYSRVMRVWGASILAGMACLPAEAGPWVQERGNGFGRLAVSSERVEGLDAWRYDSYGEYGLTSNWTITAKAETIRFVGNSDFDADGARISLRRTLWQQKSLRIAAEVGAVHGAAIGGVRGCDQLGGEARLSAGASGRWDGADWFIFADAATRIHAEGCWRDRIEIGAGREIAHNVFLTNQIWLERGSEESRSDKIETGLLYRARQYDISLAYRQEISGRFEEDGIVIALARRF